jgi:hypothetical protein
MRDHLAVICISLRVCVTSYEADGERYTDRDIHGRGTTFEMALFDLSAQLIKLLGDNDLIDTENIPILEETGVPTVKEGPNREDNPHDNKSVRTNEPNPVGSAVENPDEDAGKGMAARSDGASGSRPGEQRDRGSGGKAADGSGGGKCPKRSRGRSQ